jgi:hypothetical protein
MAVTAFNLARMYLSSFTFNNLAFASALVKQHRLAAFHFIAMGKMGNVFPT